MDLIELITDGPFPLENEISSRKINEDIYCRRINEKYPPQRINYIGSTVENRSLLEFAKL